MEKIWKKILGWKQNFYEMYESFINLLICNMFVFIVFSFFLHKILFFLCFMNEAQWN